MTYMLSLRTRILLTLAPPLLLAAVISSAAALLLSHLSGSIDAMLRDDYDSVIFMERLNEALDHIDASFQFALAGEEKKARQQYEENWPIYSEYLLREQNNVTVPGEGDLVNTLTELTERYRKQGDAFFHETSREQRQKEYSGPGGLQVAFRDTKVAANAILWLNHEDMESVNRHKRRLVHDAVIWFGVGLLVVGLFAVFIAWPFRAILSPIKTLTRTTREIGLGNLDQVVPVMSDDELGQLANAFNTMARQLREYRQSSYSRLLTAQRTSQATVDSFSDPVVVVDYEGQVEMANPAARRLLGVQTGKGDQTPRMPWQAPESLRRPLEEALKNQQEYVPEGLEHALRLRTDGTDHFFLPHIRSIRDPYGNTLGAAILLQDVTRFRLLDEVKSDLVATVSHELKTPLTSIRLAVHLLLEEAAGPLTPKQVELLVDTRENAERLLALVNNLLGLAKLERKAEQLDRKPESPTAILHAAADQILPRAQDKGITLAVKAADDLPPVAVDAYRLGHALGNLLDNALRVTERGGKIALSASAAGDTVTLAVSDSGPGIPAEYLPHIFKRFFRVPGQSPEQGTGLGLAIVHEIVAAHGGTITCESQVGSGTTFRINLPACKPSNGEEPDLALSGADAASH